MVTNLPYGDLEELAEILVKLGTRDRCNVALLVRAEWPIAKARLNLIYTHPWFHGIVQLTSRPRWVERDEGPQVTSAQLRLGHMGRAAARRGCVDPMGRKDPANSRRTAK